MWCIVARILVIDDEYEVRVALRKILARAGHEVVEAANSEEGVRLFLQEPTDLVITDLFVPVKGGLEIIRELKANYPEVKIIVISGSAADFLRDTTSLAKQYGALRALEKPFSPEEIIEAVQELLEEN